MFSSDEKGSATVEFVLLALPLFLPLFFYLNQYAIQSDIESSMRTVSREMARAFVTAENDDVAFEVSEEVFLKMSEVLGYKEDTARGDLHYTIECVDSPCISPNNEVQVRLRSESLNRTITAIEYVSPWA